MGEVKLQHLLRARREGTDQPALQVLQHTLIILYIQAVQYLLRPAIDHAFFY